MTAKFLVSFVCIIYLSASQLFGITITENGKSNYTIVVSTEASPSELHGANELQYFLQIITGVNLPISRDNENIPGPMILVGNGSALQKIDPSIDFKSLGDEGLIIKTVGNNLILAGGKLRGSMYAVYTFLEKIGCRWYSTESSVIPSLKVLNVEPINEIQKPAFVYREPLWWDAFDADWAARNKCNSSNARLDEQRGGKYKYWGGHSFYPLVPPDTYFKDHPEYYSQINGKRIWEFAQLCLTNQELVKLMTNNILKVINRDPSYNVYEISQNDWANWCTCADCKAIDDREGSHAGTVVNFVNLVADRTKKDYPDKLIGTFAYWYSENAPKAIKARDNVCIRLCNIIGCDGHPLTECQINIKRFVKNMVGWKKLAKNIIIWDYVTNFHHYLQPHPNWYATWKDIQYFKKMGVIGVFEEGGPETEATSGGELEAYLQAKNLWNPDIDYHVILDDFLNGFYHKAAPAIRKYMDFLQDKVNTGPIHITLYSPPTTNLFTPENIAACDQYLKEASQLVQNDLEAAYRVEEVMLGIKYVKLARPIEHVMDGNQFKVTTTPAPLANLKDLNKFMEDIKNHEVSRLREARAMETPYGVLRANVSDHQVITLENPYLKVDVIPSLAGKIYQVSDKKTGRNIFRLSTVKEFPYPLVGGYTEIPVYSEVFTSTVERTAEGQKIIMQAYVPFRGTSNALKVTRTISVPADKKEIRISSMMECIKEVERPIRINPNLDLAIGKREDTRAGVKTAEGNYALKEIKIERDDWNRIVPVAFRDKDIKTGSLVIINPVENTGVISLFNPGEIEACTITVDTTTGGINMGLLGNQRVMKPGEKQTLSHTIIPVDDVASIMKKE